MTGDTGSIASTGGADEPIKTDDLARYAAAAAAADDPEQVLGPVTAIFGDLHRLVQAGDRLAADGASLAVQDLGLQLCASEAASARAGDDKCRVLAIIASWAWPRTAAVGAVLAESHAWEMRRWGQAVEGSG